VSARTARQFAGFVFAGAVGFVVDVAVLYLLKGFVGLYWGRLGSFLAAAFVTWLLNRRIAFRDRRAGVGLTGEFTAYLSLMAVGAAANLGVYTALLLGFPALTRMPVVAVAAGSLSGLLLNFASARLLLYRAPRQPRP
jgi:putative flippase GtrA